MVSELTWAVVIPANWSVVMATTWSVVRAATWLVPMAATWVFFRARICESELKAAICAVTSAKIWFTDKLLITAVLKLPTEDVFSAATWAVDMAATCTLVNKDIWSELDTAISAVAIERIKLKLALDIPVIGVAIDHPLSPGKYQYV